MNKKKLKKKAICVTMSNSINGEAMKKSLTFENLVNKKENEDEFYIRLIDEVLTAISTFQVKKNKFIKLNFTGFLLTKNNSLILNFEAINLLKKIFDINLEVSEKNGRILVSDNRGSQNYDKKLYINFILKDYFENINEYLKKEEFEQALKIKR